MFERFTDRARRVLVLAQEEAHLLHHNFIGTEHILLGLIDEGEGVAAKALEALGISYQNARAKIEETIGPTDAPLTGSPPFTPRSKRVLELSLREALKLGHDYIGTEHILLGLVREGQGVAAQVLHQQLLRDLQVVHEQVLTLLEFPGEDPNPLIPSPESQLRTRMIRGLEWPQFPSRTVRGIDTRLSVGDLEFRVVGVMLYDVGILVAWCLSGMPEPLINLIQDPALFSPNRPFAESTTHPKRGAGGLVRPLINELDDWQPFLKISDDLATPYLQATGTFEPQVNGEWAGRSYFVPKLPDGARVVNVEWQSQVLAISI